MMIDKVIEADGLSATAGGACLSIRLPWYRSLPLSTVDVDAVNIDGKPIAASTMRFALQGEQWPVASLRRLTEKFWFVTDSAQLHLVGLTLERGSEHDVEVILSIYPPYVKGLRRLVKWTKRLRVAQERAA